MAEDPIVAETRQAREAYAASLGYDLARIVSDLQSRQGRDGRQVLDRTLLRPFDHGEVADSHVPHEKPAPRTDWPALAPNRPQTTWMAEAIGRYQGATPRQSTLLRAGLFLMSDFLDESHAQSQSLEGDRDADLWHAIMHRREPDYGNAKYWCRRVGTHPIQAELAIQAAPILAIAGVTGFSSMSWDASRFVDLCERVAHEESSANRAAREVQWLEMTLHLAHCSQGR